MAFYLKAEQAPEDHRFRHRPHSDSQRDEHARSHQLVNEIPARAAQAREVDEEDTRPIKSAGSSQLDSTG
jgi:hypothetical protein